MRSSVGIDIPRHVLLPREVFSVGVTGAAVSWAAVGGGTSGALQARRVEGALQGLVRGNPAALASRLVLPVRAGIETPAF